MPIRCDTSDAPAFVRYTFEGDWTAGELIERRRDLIRDGKLTVETAVLFDLRAATNIPDLAELHPALHAGATDAIWPVCRAFVVTTNPQYDCARRLQAMLGPQSVINEIFEDEGEALEWLAAMSSRTRATRT
ncbi:MAG TPA: hypothetical protein VJ691_07920 [Vicinamibacterales bacterium]|nr:hypothetical protein [Vicinamibacterales bacterium]